MESKYVTDVLNIKFCIRDMKLVLVDPGVVCGPGILNKHLWA